MQANCRNDCVVDATAAKEKGQQSLTVGFGDRGYGVMRTPAVVIDGKVSFTVVGCHYAVPLISRFCFNSSTTSLILAKPRNTTFDGASMQ